MKTRFFLVIGVSGSGKSSVGKSLAGQLGWSFYDADDFHPSENLIKMKSGVPLNDSDRAPWLASLHDLITSSLWTDQPGVLACSALKESYRQRLLDGSNSVQVVFLKGDYSLIWSRMSARRDHFMQPHMLQSQFDTLEEPANALVMDISLPVDVIVRKILEQTCDP